MIKFVCASCGERLSVPEAHGGRKGVCPTCGAINRIPLKGYAETQPRAPIVARLAGNVTEPPARVADPIVRGALSVPALSGRADEPEPPAREQAEETSQDEIADEPATGQSDESEDYAASIDDEESEESIMEQPVPAPPSASDGKPAQPAASLEVFGSVPLTAAVPEKQIVTSSRLKETARADAPPADFVEEAPISREWRLPKPVKIFLLMFFVLAIVGGLYCALYFGIPALMRMLSSG